MQRRYWRLSRFYFFYFASLGALIPFWSVYLDNLGFDALAIGQLMATLAVSKIVAPYLWGWIADRSGLHIRIVQIASLLSLLCFLPLVWLDSFWPILLSMLAFSFFWNASLPQFEVVTLGQLGDDRHRYSQIRLWGSLGFILTVVVLGAAFQDLDISTLPYFLLLLFFAIWLSTLRVADSGDSEPSSSSILQVLRQPAVIALLLTCFFAQASHGPYYTFYSLYMESLGYSRVSIGLLWSLGVLAEVVLFFYMHRLLNVRSASFWLVVALGLTSLRWVLMGLFSDSTVIVLLSQCLHAASFGLFHAAAIHQIHAFFPRHHGRGQALYSAASFGAGGAVGSLFAGSLWETLSPTHTFMVAALIAFIGMLFALRVKLPVAQP
jgi:PPP family 3-phenylpropionic acid transporter